MPLTLTYHHHRRRHRVTAKVVILRKPGEFPQRSDLAQILYTDRL